MSKKKETLFSRNIKSIWIAVIAVVISILFVGVLVTNYSLPQMFALQFGDFLSRIDKRYTSFFDPITGTLEGIVSLISLILIIFSIFRYRSKNKKSSNIVH